MKQRSKRLVWTIVGMTFALTAYALFRELEGAAMALWSAGIPAATALYANKQFQDRKWGEIKATQNNKEQPLEKDWDKIN